MKFLHLSDLHLGKQVNGYSMIEDQTYILDEILKIIDEHHIDACMLSGDIYDKSIPSIQAVTLLDYFLNELAKRKQLVYIISGNHDSSDRLAFGHDLMRNTNIFIETEIKETIHYEEIGNVRIYMLPFFKPANVRLIYPEVESYDDAFKKLISTVKLDHDYVNILMMHQFMVGASTCESEEMNVGGIDSISVEPLYDFDYVALGHIHRPQKIIKDYIRYSGTFLKYSFSEVDQNKSVVIYDTETRSIELVELVPLRDMHEISGKYDDIMHERKYTDSYVHITLTDELDVLNAFGKLKTVYPYLMRLDYDNQRTRSNNDIMTHGVNKEKSFIENLDEFYKLQNNVNLNEKQRTLLIELWEHLS